MTLLAVFGLFGAEASAQVPTPDGFAAQANEICATADKRVDKKVKKLNNGKGALDPEFHPVRSGKAFKKTLPIARRAYGDIADITPPPEEAEAIATWLSLSRRAINQLDKGASALLREDLKGWNRYSGRSLKLAHRGASAVEHLPMPGCTES